MCGSKLEQSVTAIPIDDNDPLALEARVYNLQDPAQFRERDRQRTAVRDSVARNASPRHQAATSSISVENFPPGTAEEEAVEELRESKPTNRATGIGGPSFLGLGYEESSAGFVYDKPRNDGFIYDTDGQTPEYLLEEVPRSVSWRAWALFALLLVGAGLGYIQWRASHNQGPDIASILAGNATTVDPNGPVMTDKSAKSAAQKSSTPAGEASQTDSPKKTDNNESSSDAEEKNASTSSGDPGPKAASTNAVANSDDHSTSPDSSEEANSPAPVAKDSEEASKPESDGPVSKATRPKHAALTPVAKTAEPKSLGDKDPLILQAEKYIQGRGTRQNCSAGVNLLRQAVSAGNPQASVKMGALYWSGTCVTQSNITAYQWFARAHSLEPRNRWIERSKSSLWASLSPEEKRRVGY